jgi:AcrR family transcriptional regulator
MSRTQQEERTLHDIYRAFIFLVSSQRYSDISVMDVTQTAHISRSTFYVYFHGKKDLARSSLERLIDEFLQMTVTSSFSDAHTYEHVDLDAARYFQENGPALRQLIALPQMNDVVETRIHTFMASRATPTSRHSSEDQTLVSIVVSTTFTEALRNPSSAQHYASGIVNGLVRTLLTIVPHDNQGATLSARSLAYHFFGKHL